MAVLNTFIIMLQDYDMIPNEMRVYLRNNGRHFNRKACEFAVSKMRKWNEASRLFERIEPLNKEQVDELLKTNGVQLSHEDGYDHVYIANMCRADFFGTAIDDERHLALYVKCVVEDADAVSGMIFNRWLADCDTKGLVIDWEELL